MKKSRKNNVAILLTFSLVGTTLLAMPGVAYASEINTTKEENVYAVLNGDGSVQGVYVVNAYDLKSDTTVIDYGSYTAIKNLTNENSIDTNGNELTVDAQKGKFYYQGDLATKDLPWTIAIHYYLDGREVAADDLAGQSGTLKIEIALTENTAVDASFFENYLLQATVALPADHCTNIVADGATVANISGDKQILFNVMGGQEKTLTLTADVTDFEMSAISFKGVPMSFDISVDDIDTSELTEKTDELNDGVTKLNDGAGDLQDGSEKLQDGLTTYTEGVDSLYSGAAALAKGVDTLQEGATSYTGAVNKLSDGATTLAEKTENMPALMTSLSEAIAALNDGTALMADENSGAAAQITSALEEIEAGLVKMKAGLSAMNSQGLAPMLSGLETMETSMDALETGLSGANQYAQSLGQIQSEYASEVTLLSEIMESMSDMTATTAAAATVNNESVSNSQTADSSADQSGTADTQTSSTETTESQTTETSEPQVTTSTETVQGDYQEDRTDTTTDESTDEDGNKVVTITNNIYMTRENTTTITNEKTINTETVITKNTTVNNETVINDTSAQQAAAQTKAQSDTAEDLTSLYGRMAKNAATLSAVINGAGGNPGLTTILDNCENGVAQAKTALFVDTEEQTSLKTALTVLQGQIVGENGAIAAVDQMIAGVELLKAAVSGDSSDSLQSNLSTLSGSLTALNAQTQTLPDIGLQLSNGITTLSGSLSQLDSKSSSLNSGVSNLQSGAGKLNEGAKKLADNNSTIMDGVDELTSGVDELKDGTQELADQTVDMDDQILDTLETKLQNFTGEDYEGISFVSTDNINVDAVQFAMQTQDITIPETEEAVVEETEPTLWDRFKALFQ